MILFIVLVVLSLNFWTARASSELIFVCPGRRVSLNCSQEPPRSGITWRIWCQCSADTSGPCGDTCSTIIPNDIVDTSDEFHQGTVCGHHDPAIVYSITFTTIEEGGDIFVPSSSVLDIAVPLDFHQETATTLCVECQRQFSRHLIVPGSPSLPNNLEINPDYITSTESSTEVNLVWLPAPELNYSELDVEYTIVITESDNSAILYNHNTSSTNFTARLQVNITYSITLYASTCNHTLISEPLVTNITIIEEGTDRLPPSTTLGDVTVTDSNVEIIELTPCREEIITTVLVTTSAQPDCSCVFLTLSVAIAVSASAMMTLFLNAIAFTLGVLVGVCRSKTRQQASATVSAAQSEAASAGMSETGTGVELERVHDYEDIVLTETKDTFTTNVAYGCTHP